MIIKIVAVGRLKERHWQDGAADYARRLQPYARLEMVEVPEARLPERASLAEEMKAVHREALAIMERLRQHHGPVIALDRQGKMLDSMEMASWLDKQTLEGRNETAWVIGGPFGLAQSVLDRADLVLSFSKMTFPRQMMRLILLEQIYRAFRIIHHEPYHK